MTDERQSETVDEPGVEMLHARLVHAPAAKMRIEGIDSADAEAVGAIVLTGQQTIDLHPYHGPVVGDRPLLAIDRVRYLGEPVAAVAAATPELAEEAARLVEISLAPLPATATGVRPGEALLVHLTDLLPLGPYGEGIPLSSHAGNRLAIAVRQWGEPSPATIEMPRTVYIDTPLSGDLEPLQAIAQWQDNRLIVWSPSDEPGAVQAELAGIFGLADDQIDINPLATAQIPVVPGSIGIEGVTAALARRARRPVHLVAGYDKLGWTGPSGMLEISGNEAGGHNILLRMDAGAFAGNLPRMIGPIAESIAEQANIVSGKVTVEIVYSFAPPVAASLDQWREAIRLALERAGIAT
jgi:CO/xanthine dehydrogenase Mo-binding subunit